MSVTQAIALARNRLGPVVKTPTGWVVQFYDPEVCGYVNHHFGDGKEAKRGAADLVLLRALEILADIPAADLRKRLDLEALRRRSSQTMNRVVLALLELDTPPPPTPPSPWRTRR